MNEQKKISKLNDILKIRFTPTLKGYSPLEVDNCLDDIYDFVYSLNTKFNNSLDELTKLNRQLEIAARRIQDLEVEIVSLKRKLENTAFGNADTKGNLDYLKRINQLELALHKAGIDPNSI